MPRFINPTVLVTRPPDSSHRFIVALEKVAGPFAPLVMPAFEIASTDAAIPDFDVAIFTSRAGVASAPSGDGRQCYCVGYATAGAAKTAGYDPISAQGSASDLIDLILKQRPAGQLLHIRGETSVGNVATTLHSHGLPCAEVIAYRKKPSLPTPQSIALLKESDNLILPVFSAETVSILADWNIDFTNAHIVAISPAVAVAAQALLPASLVTTGHPDLNEMVAQTASLIA